MQNVKALPLPKNDFNNCSFTPLSLDLLWVEANVATNFDGTCIFLVYIVDINSWVMISYSKSRAGGMSSQLVWPNLTMKTMQLNAWVADNFMSIEILFVPLIL